MLARNYVKILFNIKLNLFVFTKILPGVVVGLGLGIEEQFVLFFLFKLKAEI